MNTLNRVRQYFAKPDKNTSLAIMFAGFAVYAVGALLGNRFVAVGGWLVCVAAIVNYVRWFFSDHGIQPKTRQPWEE